MLSVMKRPFLLVSFLLVLAFHLEGASVLSQAQVQPFDSKSALEAIDFLGPASEAEQDYAKDFAISVLVMGPLKPLYSWFGHVAFLVEMPDGKSVVYDYGVFDAKKPGFVLDFLKGRMNYNVWKTDGGWRLVQEEESGRKIVRYLLPLTPKEKIGIITFLEENTKSGNDRYLYHFYKDNCATRIRDVLDAASGGAFKKWAEAKEFRTVTYRSEANRILSKHPLVCWALNFLEGPEIDRSITGWDAMFLPETLGASISGFYKIPGEVIQEGIYPTRDGKPLFALVMLPLAVGLALAFLLVLVRKKVLWRHVMEVLLFGFGLLSCLLCYGMCFTDLDVMWGNMTILYLNPLLLWVVKEIHQQRERHACTILKGLSLVAVALLLYSLTKPTSNLSTLLVVLPVYLSAWVRDGHSMRE